MTDFHGAKEKKFKAKTKVRIGVSEPQDLSHQFQYMEDEEKRERSIAKISIISLQEKNEVTRRNKKSKKHKKKETYQAN